MRKAVAFSARATRSPRLHQHSMAVGVVQYSTNPIAAGVHHDHLAGQIFGGRIRRRRAPVRRLQIVQKLYPRPGRRAQTRDPYTDARHGREPFLLGAPVLAGTGDAQTQPAAVKVEARLSVSHDNSGMINPEEQAILLLPARVALAGRELNQFERMTVAIAEINRADSPGIGVPGGQL